MSTAVAVSNKQKFLTAQEVQAAANLIQQVMKAVMKENIHYGKVQGCGDKPTLLKPGAEKILATFRIAVDPEIEDLSVADCVKYRIKARGIHTTPDGDQIEVGKGVGVCSSNEEKYKWRKAVGKEWDETPEDRRRKKWKKGFSGKSDYQELQVRTSPEDLENTILKMAKKRALVDLCLTATAASDCFNQDIEDLPAEYVAQEEEPTIQVEPISMPRPKNGAAPEEAKQDAPPAAAASQNGAFEGFKQLKAKFDGNCKGCNKEIKAGSDLAFNPKKGNFHPECAK